MKIATVILILCILNFVAFAVVSIMHGGSSGNGFTEGERYYFSDHGKITEVSQQIWNYSAWHTKSLFVTHPLAVILFIILGAKWEEKRKLKANQQPIKMQNKIR